MEETLNHSGDMPFNVYSNETKTLQYLDDIQMETHNGDKIRNITIRELNRGFIIDVGCHSFAITNVSDVIKYLTEYLNNPNQTEKNWFSNKLLTR